ncbi:hypothetical protein BG015_003334 [Linnemannia schmuckeri]|uniref:Uncharacterized protein n=1 Tax=Linnemannia schmuckeri TaxID=64567 RepID=A0A9P5V4X9_9FUNG|nr:hypothetical protein BG015_003334 [Linnemannia schmuckeri]
MDCKDLWRFFRDKNYKPTVRYRQHQREVLKDSEANKVRIDVEGSIYATIRYAYIHSNSLEAAHSLVYKWIQKLSSQDISVLYFDGGPLEEKKGTHDEREQRRAKALLSADKVVQHFADRVDNNSRIRKQHFVNVNKQLTNTFRRDPADRHSLAMYCRDRDWTVVESDMERQRRPQHHYSHLATDIWRPISGGGFLEYVMDDVYGSVGFTTRNHFTLLGIVSWNDYNRNVYSLGCATNFKIIKGIPLDMDIPAMVDAYLSDEHVILKNRDKLTFEASIRVFAHRRETPLRPDTTAITLARNSDAPLSDILPALTLEDVKTRFEEAKMRGSSESRVYRQKAGQQFNRYRTIDRPPPKDKKQTTNGASPKDKNITSDNSAKVLNSSTNTMTPQPQRPRYWARKRSRNGSQEPPSTMTQYRWKP